MQYHTDSDFLSGSILFFDKPYGWTSFQLVKKVRWLISKKLDVKKIKVGHAGTLDPMASGLMIICTGKATKKIDTFMGLEKEYIATMKLGSTTPSYDLETEIDERYETNHITEALIREKLVDFLGIQDQVPPLFSAINIKGKRAYEYARAGKTLELNARPITFHELELLEKKGDEVVIRILCSKGTYVRSFARDFGMALASGAHLINLKRSAIGNYRLEEAMSIDIFEKKMKEATEHRSSK